MMKGIISVLIILIAFPSVKPSEKTCDVPTFMENGFFEMPHRRTGGTVTFTCFDGYWYTGTKTRTCQANGQWSGDPGICRGVQCPMMNDPPNGKVESTGRKFRDTASVICDEGYIYSDPEVNQQICRGDNTWTSKSGECLGVKCLDIPTIQHGEIVYSGKGFKDKADVKCNEGYIYSKPESITRTCQGDNTWSLQFDGKCQYLTCPIIPLIENGNFSSTQNHYGANITLTCQTGYTLHGAHKITCEASGMWSESPGVCIKEPWNRNLLWLIGIPVVFIAVTCLIVNRRCVRKTVCKKRSEPRRHDSPDGHLNEDVPFMSHNMTTQLPPSPTSMPGSPANSGHYCSFTVEDDLTAAISNTQSAEYMSFTSTIKDGVKTMLQDHGKTTNVHVTCVSPTKKLVFMDIECQDQLTEDAIRSAFTSEETELDMHGINVAKDSLIFRDDISQALATDTIRKEHVPQNEDRKINFLSQYVNLKILSQQEFTAITRDEIEQPDKYLSNLENNQANIIKDKEVLSTGDVIKYILIRGRAGIGKTTLVQRLMWRWAHGEWATHFKAFFLLNLRVLMAMTTDMTLPDLLSECAVYKVADSHRTLNAKWLVDNEKYVGFILDGLDEVHGFSLLWDKIYENGTITDKARPLSWAFCLMKRECMKSSTLIVTSRPFAGLTTMRPVTTKMIEVMGLTRERIIEFVDRNVGSDRKNMVTQTLLNSPILLSVSAITFYCAALCSVLQDDIGVTDKLTTYTQITAYIIQMFIHRTYASKNGPATLASSWLRSMCRLAYDGLIKRTDRGLATLVFDSKDFEAHNIQQTDVDNAIQAGLFLQTEVPTQTDSEKRRVLGEFVHLAIQEFLAMAGLLMESPEDVKKALDRMSTSGQFNMGFLFLYGLAFNTTSEAIQTLRQAVGGFSDVGEEVYAILQKTVMDMPGDLQVLQMVHESQSSDVARLVGGKRFQKEVKISRTKLTVVDVLAMTFLLKHHAAATTISLKDVGLDDVSCRELSRFLESNRSVTTVQLYDDGIDDTGLKHIASALKENKGVKKLVLESKNVRDPALTSLADTLKTNKTLTDLRIQAVNVTETGIKQIADALRSNTTLTKFKILSNNVTDSVLSYLMNALERNGTLTDLRIISSSITSAGVRCLAAALEQNTSLKAVCLGWANVNDEAVDKLLEALELNKIVTVRFQDPICDQKAKTKLQGNSRINII